MAKSKAKQTCLCLISVCVCVCCASTVQVWLPILLQLVGEACNAVQPAAAAAFGENDPRFYVKVRATGFSCHDEPSCSCMSWLWYQLGSFMTSLFCMRRDTQTQWPCTLGPHWAGWLMLPALC